VASHLAESSTRKNIRKIIGWSSLLIVVCVVGLVALFAQPAPEVRPQVAAHPGVIITSDDGVGTHVAEPSETPTQSTPQETKEPAPLPVVEATSQPVVSPSKSPDIVTVPLKADPIRIEIPEANIDTTVSLQPLSGNERQARYLKPPNDPTAYWSDLFDRPGSDSTDLTYISGHGCEGLAICNEIDWPFSRLSDPNLVKEGTAVVVHTTNGKVCYGVDRPIATYPKASLKNQAEVFGKSPLPGRLVLVSCYTGSIHDRNVVAIASQLPCDR
jgi:hypothetical protein